MKGLRTALFISIAANILLVGVIGGAVVSNARHERLATQNAVARIGGSETTPPKHLSVGEWKV